MGRTSALLLTPVVWLSVAPAIDARGGSLPGETCSAHSGTNCQAVIPDGPGGVLVSSFVYPSSVCGGFIDDANIGVDIVHPRVGDLEITVTGPSVLPRSPTGSGIDVMLFDRDCGATEDMQAIWDDEGTPHPCPPVGLGRWLPEDSLQALDGFIAAWVWELTIVDHAAGEVGTLEDWSVEVTCLSPIGACCLPGGSCLDTDPFSCEEANGSFQGFGTTCDAVVCEVPTVPPMWLASVVLVLGGVGCRKLRLKRSAS